MMGSKRRAGTNLNDLGHNRILRKISISANGMLQMYLRKA
jgi:hypothetical protein